MTSDPICPERGIPQSECPPFCPHDFGPVGPDGFTRLAGYVAEYVNDSPAALRAKVAEHQWNALEMSRKADASERRAEEAEYHVEQLRDALDSAERQAERLEAVLAQVKWAFDLQCPPMSPEKYVDRGAWMAHSWWNTVLGSILNRANDDKDAVLCPCGEPIGHADHCDSCCGCGAVDQHEHMATVEHLRRCPICNMRFEEPCRHHWLERPESDTRECLICGAEVAG